MSGQFQNSSEVLKMARVSLPSQRDVVLHMQMNPGSEDFEEQRQWCARATVTSTTESVASKDRNLTSHSSGGQARYLAGKIASFWRDLRESLIPSDTSDQGLLTPSNLSGEGWENHSHPLVSTGDCFQDPQIPKSADAQIP